jgi:uncharacterized protein
LIEWLVYWFMFPACIGIVSLAMMLGIDGTAILTPAVILLFPLLSVPAVPAGAAVAAGLFTEFFGYLSGVVGYNRAGLIDYKVGIRLSLVAIPSIAVASVLAQFSPALALELVFGVLMVGLSAYLLFTSKSTVRSPLLEAIPPEAARIPRVRESLEETVIRTKVGREYRYKVCDKRTGELVCAIGSAFEGMISVGLGELVMPDLIRRCKVPVSVSAATSVFVMTVAVLAGSATGIASLALRGGVSAIPLNLLLFTVPGAVIGGQIGSKAQGRLSSLTMERLIVVIFAVVGVSFLYVSAAGILG